MTYCDVWFLRESFTRSCSSWYMAIREMEHFFIIGGHSARILEITICRISERGAEIVTFQLDIRI